MHSLLTDFNSSSSINLEPDNKSRFISDTSKCSQAQSGSNKSNLKVVIFPEQLSKVGLGHGHDVPCINHQNGLISHRYCMVSYSETRVSEPNLSPDRPEERRLLPYVISLVYIPTFPHSQRWSMLPTPTASALYSDQPTAVLIPGNFYNNL